MIFRSLFCCVLLSAGVWSNAQEKADTIAANSFEQKLRFNYKQLIIPTALIGYGVVGLNSDALQEWNLSVRNEVKSTFHRSYHLDDISLYVPAAAVYGLNAAGVEGKNNFRDRTVILVTSYAIMYSTVLGVKSITKKKRPDGTTNDSFPSGHTATAFAGAEFLYQEYRDESIWYGVGGYMIAAGTGVLRIINNRHWVTDVVTGAGIGILSTKLAYWSNRFITELLFNEKEGTNKTTYLFPFYDGRNAGCTVTVSF